MSALARFGVALQSLEATALGVVELLPSRLSTAAVTALNGVDAAGMSLFSELLRVPIGSSDTAAALAQQLQFTEGDGPCFAAHRGQQVIAADQFTLVQRWPEFTTRLLDRTPYRAVLSLPLPKPLAGSGTLDLYFVRSVPPDRMPIDQAQLVATRISAALARDQVDVTAEDYFSKPAWLDNPSAASRFVVPIASGMVLVRTGKGFPDVLGMLRSRAIAQNRTVDALAGDIVEGTVPVDTLIQ